MYILTKFAIWKQRVKVFGIVLPIYEKKEHCDSIGIGTFETLEEAEKAACKLIGLNKAFFTGADGRYVCFTDWRNYRHTKCKEVYEIIRTES